MLRQVRSMAGVYLVLFLIGAETFLVSPLLPTIAADLHASDNAVATTVTAYTLAYALSAPLLSPVFDAVPRRTAITLGAVLFLAGNVLAGVAGDLTILIAARVVSALGAAVGGPAIWAHVNDRAEEAARGRAMGLGLAFFSAGTALGVPAASLAAGTGGWRASFLVLAGATVAVLPLAWIQTRPPAPTSAPPRRAPLGRTLSVSLSVWSDPTLRVALVVVLLFQAANLGAYTFLGAVLDSHFDLPVGALGLVGVLVGVGGAAGSLVAGRLGDAGSGDRAHRRWIPLWCLVLGAGIAVAAWRGPLPVAALAVLAWFFASGAFSANVQTLLVSVRSDLAAVASSWNSALLYGGAAIGVASIQALPGRSVAFAAVGAGLALVATAVSLRLLTPGVSRGHTIAGNRIATPLDRTGPAGHSE